MRSDPKTSRTNVDLGFAAMEQAAAAGDRCPTNYSKENPGGTIRGGVTTALLKEGKIRVEVYAHNWRVVEILTGPHAGKRTKAPPYLFATKPYLVLPATPVTKLVPPVTESTS